VRAAFAQQVVGAQVDSARRREKFGRSPRPANARFSVTEGRSGEGHARAGTASRAGPTVGAFELQCQAFGRACGRRFPGGFEGSCSKRHARGSGSSCSSTSSSSGSIVRMVLEPRRRDSPSSSSRLDQHRDEDRGRASAQLLQQPLPGPSRVLSARSPWATVGRAACRARSSSLSGRALCWRSSRLPRESSVRRSPPSKIACRLSSDPGSSRPWSRPTRRDATVAGVNATPDASKCSFPPPARFKVPSEIDSAHRRVHPGRRTRSSSGFLREAPSSNFLITTRASTNCSRRIDCCS